MTINTDLPRHAVLKGLPTIVLPRHIGGARLVVRLTYVLRVPALVGSSGFFRFGKRISSSARGAKEYSLAKSLLLRRRSGFDRLACCFPPVDRDIAIEFLSFENAASDYFLVDP